METRHTRNIPATELLNLHVLCRGALNVQANLCVIVAVMLSLLLSSCATTQISHVWRDPSYVSGPLKTILVVAVRKNQQTRRAWEDGFVAEMSGHGVVVTPSYRLFPDALPDTGLIATITRERRFDGILLVGRASTQTMGDVTPEFDITSSASPPYPMDAWYSANYNREYYPGYPVFDDIVKDEIKVWATQGKAQLIWTGVGEVEDSDLREDVRHAIIHLIVPELQKQGVIAGGS